jgi:hypothetical protein
VSQSLRLGANAEGIQMTRQLGRQCPRCNGIMLVKVFEPGCNTVLQAVNGFCPRCRHRLAWIVAEFKRQGMYFAFAMVKTRR